ncbi:CLUMA_CG016185, isoform A [Clunio marinus]|uniref:CLUMA_CG016185, isoform A n=1 Tax=Clunio marinus TaxID=568069 RepID=A0A1J1IXM5_9DIPT|nr:CLUMA_CG016185, isoform A [Clunio marinus]
MNVNVAKQNMAPQNSTLINLINDDIKSITSERLSPIERNVGGTSCSDEEEDEYDDEIPIYIGHVARYVSGINRKTTCNDIIKALIDDELANTKVSKQLICEPQHYTIYERFQDIEHALGGDELIYDLWRNWGGHRNDVQFRLKIKKESIEPDNDDDVVVGECKLKSKKIKKTGIKKLLKKVLHQGEMIQKHLQEIAKANNLQQQICESRESFAFESDGRYSPSIVSEWKNHVDATDTEDELFLVIENNNDNDSGVFITKEQFFHDMEIDQPKSIDGTPKRKFRNSRDFQSLKGHAITTLNPQENFTRASDEFEFAHKQICSEMNGVKEIIEQERSFLRKINKFTYNDHHQFNNTSQTNSEFVDNIYEYCDNNETIIV